ncbi:MAG: hypothetical protein HY834_15955 [Devosia nanyangense]|jgi:hypothetical protein|uniref:Uncharacterized protein n=1 Tax=Devosia nanyangense TaxID=1228055 RepID=A0A933L406_9HYPH|nr:hypothetical protein [Devosia nanyangense]
MQHQSLRPPSLKPVAIEVDGEPLGVVVRADDGYRFLAVRLSAFALDGHIFETVEAAQIAIGDAIRDNDARP